MKRVYTDERFPGHQIVNSGDDIFEVCRGNRVLSTFTSWEKPDGTISEAFAARRAADYFARWAVRDLGEAAEDMRQITPDEFDKVDHTDIFNAPPNPTRQIDRLMSQEKVERDPQRRAALRRHALHLMKQEESTAAAVVSHLIES